MGAGDNGGQRDALREREGGKRGRKILCGCVLSIIYGVRTDQYVKRMYTTLAFCSRLEVCAYLLAAADGSVDGTWIKHHTVNLVHLDEHSVFETRRV